jgi:hypothetical protein
MFSRWGVPQERRGGGERYHLAPVPHCPRAWKDHQWRRPFQPSSGCEGGRRHGDEQAGRVEGRKHPNNGFARSRRRSSGHAVRKKEARRPPTSRARPRVARAAEEREIIPLLWPCQRRRSPRTMPDRIQTPFILHCNKEHPLKTGPNRSLTTTGVPPTPRQNGLRGFFGWRGTLTHQPALLNAILDNADCLCKSVDCAELKVRTLQYWCP